MAKKRIVVPPAPKPEEITSKTQETLVAWISYFKGLSPRIKLLTPQDPEFNLARYEEQANLGLGFSSNSGDVTIVGWPSLDRVAFIVSINTAVIGEPEYQLGNTVLFCFGDFAFFLEGEFEQGKRMYEHVLEYFFSEFGSPKARTWLWRAHCLAERLREFERDMVPPFLEKA